jgi:hypothetical protein
MPRTTAPQFQWGDMSPEAQAAGEEAGAYFHELRDIPPDYQAWKKTVIGLGHIRAEALRLNGLGPKDVHNQYYKRTFKQLLHEPQAGDLKFLTADNYRAIRSNCLWWSERIDSVDTWFHGLDERLRSTYNHPRTIWRHHPEGRQQNRNHEPDNPNTVIDPDSGEEIPIVHPSREEQEDRHMQFLAEENARHRDREDARRRDPWGTAELLLEELEARDPARLIELLNRVLERLYAAQSEMMAERQTVEEAAEAELGT